jgi:hypothetical protein
MRVWITKYALTTGITEAEANTCSSSTDGRMIEVPSKLCYASYFHRPDWHETKEAAIARAEVMRKKKLASLKKQISRLEALSFDG